MSERNDDDLPLHDDGVEDFPIGEDAPTTPLGERARRTPPVLAIVAVVVLLVGAAIIGWWWASGEADEADDVADEPTRGTYARPPAPPPETGEPEPPPLVLPSLDESDEVIRREVGTLADHPMAERWLGERDLVRRFVATIDTLARGESPRKIVPFLKPESGFSTTARAGDGSGEGRVIDPASYDRYNSFAAIASATDIDATVHLYRQIEPLVDQAFGEIARPGTRFRERLLTAIDELLAVPVRRAPINVVPHPETATLWAYADPELEALSPAQKHLLRMGPENIRRIQDQLRRIQTELTEPTTR